MGNLKSREKKWHSQSHRTQTSRPQPRVLMSLNSVFLETVGFSPPRMEIYPEGKVKVKVAQLCPTLCDPIDCSLPGSSVHGILQARILEWVAISFSRGSSQSRDWTQVSHIVGGFFTIWATREAPRVKQPLKVQLKVKVFPRVCDWAATAKPEEPGEMFCFLTWIQPMVKFCEIHWVWDVQAWPVFACF